MTEMGYEPRTSFDWQPLAETLSARERLNREEVQALVRKVHDSWERARSNVQKAQNTHEKQANKHRRPVD